MNSMTLQDLVKGKYGRKIAYANVEEVDQSNILEIVGETLGIFYFNKRVTKYLWDYYKGDQPILYRTKTIRDDVVNKVVENHAYEAVQFKVGQSYGEPLQCVSIVKENISEYVDVFNNYLRRAHKHARNIKAGEWQSATGTAFLAAQFEKPGEKMPFRITVPTPMNTYIIYSSITEEPLVSVQEFKNLNGEWYKSCHTKTHQCIIKDGKVEQWGVHAFGGIPIVEYPNNFERISDIELVASMFDAINNMQSNRMDSIEQFVSAWVKFVNCTVDHETFQQMKMEGALVVKSNNGTDNKADVDIMTQELNQTQSQVAKQDLLDNILQILAIPKLEGNTGGDTQGAVQLRNGWDMAKTRGKLKDPIIQESEQRLNEVILNIIRVRVGKNECPIDTSQFEVIINHSPMDNMLVKAQFLDYLLKDGTHPKLAYELSTLFPDSEKAYILSKPYLDVLYKTSDDENKQNQIDDNVNQNQEPGNNQNSNGDKPPEVEE